MVPIRFEEIDRGAKGYYHILNKEIVIQSNMSENQTMKTAIHEVSHAILHDRDWLERTGENKDRMTKEVEAESVAYTVCQYFGLDTAEYSFPYIAGWSSSKDLKELNASMELIHKAAGDLIDNMMDRIKILQDERMQYAEEIKGKDLSIVERLKENSRKNEDPIRISKKELQMKCER